MVVIIKQHNESNRMIEYADKQIALYDRVVNLPTNALREKIAQRDLVAEQCQKISAWTGCLDRAEIFLQLSKDIDKFLTIKEKLNTALDNYRRVQNIIENYKKNRIIYNNDVQSYDAANREYQEALNKKITLLNESHVCPTCYSAIDEETVKKIIENQYFSLFFLLQKALASYIRKVQFSYADFCVCIREGHPVCHKHADWHCHAQYRCYK